MPRRCGQCTWRPERVWIFVGRCLSGAMICLWSGGEGRGEVGASVVCLGGASGWGGAVAEVSVGAPSK